MKHALAVCVLMSVTFGSGMSAASAKERIHLDLETYQTAISHAAGHPNERSRWHGLWAYSNGRHAEAREYFERAAYFGDKPSQYLLSVMHQSGEGGPSDPVLAYIWADLAAERGTSEPLLAYREQLWAKLSPEEQKRVTEAGPAVYERYGDAVAMRRTEHQIARFSRSKTGSRAGGDSGIMSVSFGGGQPPPRLDCPQRGNKPDSAMSQNDFYARARTNFADYWKQQDVALRAVLVGNVKVGKVQRAR
ncbi:sel1 repeat family protein [Cognatilysobacter bugurensis]|uniref:Sel1 repeat family protein n=1 Tax=Cognatilysobacter bugurensis TaxID=543356 RepID=A0A918WB16_9GAMM|nr:sel1 repeat family protein [Lysobacter bugurensis]GHA88068.1 hypothetical protein GCM10007067_27630 [Lysobacter bugurensis]